MVAQHGLSAKGGVPPIRYEAVEACLNEVAGRARELAASVHMPRIGCGLAGGKWELIEPIIRRALCEQGVEVFVYDYPPRG
jgi:O-acetyl-ADP-ribose deacetylase (regulator of RNase III)